MNKELEMPIFIEKKFDGFGERMASQRFFFKSMFSNGTFWPEI